MHALPACRRQTVRVSNAAMKKQTTSRTTSNSPAPRRAATVMRLVEREPAHAEIAKRAFEIWCGRGRPDSTDRENWLEAERQLRAELG